jgi:hypothetical protein
MNETNFNNFIAVIIPKLNMLRDSGSPITKEMINTKIEEFSVECANIPNMKMTEEDIVRLKFRIGSSFNVRVGEEAITLCRPDAIKWIHSKKSRIEWRHWNAYKSMLLSQGRSAEIIKATEDVIDDILDYSGDPTDPKKWARKGLVMGNVQSGKTQNYIGLINKAIDCGYKTIILLGGHLNDLRKQTQERVDEGVLGVTSTHLKGSKVSSPIGVGIFGPNNISTGTTTARDFNQSFKDSLGFKLTGVDPVIFTIKKHTGVLDKLYSWIREYHYLDPDTGRKLEGPLLLIDDEADYASINTKHHREEVTQTNQSIRNILSLFDRNTYVGYTATPFANIFIDPDENAFSAEEDLFPSDFMIKMAVPDNYLGQDFYFPQTLESVSKDGLNGKLKLSPTIPINDYRPIYELKGTDHIGAIPESLKEAVRAFILVVATRSLRGSDFSHNTMLVNISHLKVHQNKLEFLIKEYLDDIISALESFSDLGLEEVRKVTELYKLEVTFKNVFSINEEYQDIFPRLKDASYKIKVSAINQGKADGGQLNYSGRKEHGLCVIVIGGHKLSRGLTLEGLSISYFARNSKAYDTLMQMCRWFGYRPQYDDLCRVFLPQESIDWYTYISTAIRELYQELELMSRREQSPSEFGLKVREHPGAMIITAKNKMGYAESQVRSQDLWGQVQRRFRFLQEIDVNKRNLDFTKNFINKLTAGSSHISNSSEISNHPDISNSWDDKKSGAIIFSNVSYSDLISFIENINLPEDEIGNVALIRHLKKMRDADIPLSLPRVTLFNQTRPTSKMQYWEEPGKGLNNDDRTFLNTNYQFSEKIDLVLPKRKMEENKGVYKISSTHLGNRDDEKLFLSEDERKRVKDNLVKTPTSFDYICSDSRNYPGLTIYLFAIAVYEAGSVDKLPVKLGHGRIPTVGYTVSLPRSENLKGKTSSEIKEIVKDTKNSYQVNKIHSELQKISNYEDYDDE